MPMELIKPPHLQPGDTVAIVTCSRGIPNLAPERFKQGIRRLKDVFGLKVIEMPHARSAPDYLAEHPEVKAKDLMDAFKNPEIKGIISSIGGDDAIKMLPYIDYKVIKNNPKVVIGYSDFTVIHFMCLLAGLAPFYGPVVMCEFAENVQMDDYLVESMRNTLFTSLPIGEIEPAEKWTNEFLDWGHEVNQHKIRSYKKIPDNDRGWCFLQGGGEISGQLIGGCLDVIEPFIQGTAIWPPIEMWEDTILFLEISEDAWTPEQVKAALLHMQEKGVLSVIRGLLFGRPGGTKSYSTDFAAYEKIILEVCKAVCRKDIAIVTRMDFGHTTPGFVIPYGSVMTINCEKQKIFINEAACVPRAEKIEKTTLHQHGPQFRSKLTGVLQKSLLFTSKLKHAPQFSQNLSDILQRNFKDDGERKQYLLAAASRMANSHDTNQHNVQLLLEGLEKVSLTDDDNNTLLEIAKFAQVSGNNDQYATKLNEFVKTQSKKEENDNNNNKMMEN